MKITLSTTTTEFEVYPSTENEITEFEIHEKALSITMKSERNIVLYQTEISIEDAVKLAKLILTLNNQTNATH